MLGPGNTAASPRSGAASATAASGQRYRSSSMGTTRTTLNCSRAAKWARYAAAPGDMLAFDRMWAQTDVRDILSAIQVPTAVIHGERGDQGEAEHVASRVPGAKLLPLPGARRVA